MKPVINVHDAKTNFSKYLDQVAGGQELTFGKHGKPVAKLVPIKPNLKPRVPGALKGKIWIADDFDDPMPELMEEIENKPL